MATQADECHTVTNEAGLRGHQETAQRRRKLVVPRYLRGYRGTTLLSFLPYSLRWLSKHSSSCSGIPSAPHSSNTQLYQTPLTS